MMDSTTKSVSQERNFVDQAIELIDSQVAQLPPEQRVNAYRDHLKLFLEVLRELQDTHDQQRAILGKVYRITGGAR